MNWEAIGAVGEILGAIAVVATLLYLARQTRLGRQTTISQSRNASAIAIAEQDRDIARDPDLARLYIKGHEAPRSEFDDVEWTRFTMLARSVVYLYEEQYMQALEGTTDPTIGDIYAAAVVGFLEFPAWKAFWELETRGDARIALILAR